MLESLLILILLTNPAAKDDASAYAAKLQTYATRSVTIEHGEVANRHLAELLGISPSDLLAAGNIGKTLTKQKKVILIHLDHRAMSGDTVLEAHLWYDGREEKYVSIASENQDPLTGLADGTLPMIGYLLRDEKQPGVVGDSTVALSQLAKENAWEQLLGKIASIPPAQRAPMVYYYQIMAYVHLENRDAAVATLNKFREAYKDHILVTSAESIIPPRQHTEKELMDMGGAKTLDPLFEKNSSLEVEPLDAQSGPAPTEKTDTQKAVEEKREGKVEGEDPAQATLPDGKLEQKAELEEKHGVIIPDEENAALDEKKLDADKRQPVEHEQASDAEREQVPTLR